MASHSASATANIVGVHYRVGKKIGEGSFGVIFEGNVPASCSSIHLPSNPPRTSVGTNLLNSQTVAIKFVRTPSVLVASAVC